MLPDELPLSLPAPVDGIHASVVSWVGPTPDGVRARGMAHTMWEPGHGHPLFYSFWSGGVANLQNAPGCRGAPDKDGFFAVYAWRGDRPVGVVLVQRLAQELRPAGAPRCPVLLQGILGVWVSPDERGRGVGAALLRAAEVRRCAETASKGNYPFRAFAVSGRAEHLLKNAGLLTVALPGCQPNSVQAYALRRLAESRAAPARPKAIGQR